MPAFHALFLEWLELSEPAAEAAANATLTAAPPDLGEWLLSKGHNITEKLWGLAQPVVAASAALALKEGYDLWCATAGHPSEYARRRRLGWWMERLAALGQKDGRDDGEEDGDG